MPLEDVLARITGFAGWEAVKQRNAQTDAQQIQQAGALQTIFAHQQAAQKERDFQSALASAKTPEERVAVAERFSGASGILTHADRQTAQKGVQEMARGRLTQALQLATLAHQDRMRSATTAEARAEEIARHNGITESIQRDALANTGARLTYDTGMPAASSAAPSIAPASGSDQSATYNFQLPSGQRLSGTAPSEQQAIGIGQWALSNLPQPPAPASAGADPWATAPGVGAPNVAPAPPNQVAPVVTPAPNATAAPTAPAAAQMPPMPPEIARAPKKLQDQWLLQQTKNMASIPSGQATDAVVQAIVQGRMQIPTGFALRSPYWQDVIGRVAQQDPNFDASKYGARAAARRTFASGPEARNVTALNTVIGHLGTLDEAAAALENKDLRAFNAVTNRLAQEIGDPRIVNFEVARQAVAEETMRVFRQVNASEEEVRHWKEVLTSSSSPQQLRGSIATLGKLLDSRVNAIAQQFERTVNQGTNPARVDPANRARLDQLINQGGGNTSGGWSIRPK